MVHFISLVMSCFLIFCNPCGLELMSACLKKQHSFHTGFDGESHQSVYPKILCRPPGSVHRAGLLLESSDESVCCLDQQMGRPVTWVPSSQACACVCRGGAGTGVGLEPEAVEAGLTLDEPST